MWYKPIIQNHPQKPVGEISAHLIEQQSRKVEEFQKLLSKRLVRVL